MTRLRVSWGMDFAEGELFRTSETVVWESSRCSAKILRLTCPDGVESLPFAMVIGNSAEINRSLLSNGSSMAAVIANEFAEASGDLHRSALIEIGLALFVVTILVNALARILVWFVTRGAPARVH